MSAVIGVGNVEPAEASETTVGQEEQLEVEVEEQLASVEEEAVTETPAPPESDLPEPVVELAADTLDNDDTNPAPPAEGSEAAALADDPPSAETGPETGSPAETSDAVNLEPGSETTPVASAPGEL